MLKPSISKQAPLNASENDRTHPYYLQASIGALGDMWGPVWSASLGDLDSESTSQLYNIGNGTIFPWPWSPEAGISEIPVGVRVCHWLPFNLLEEIESATPAFGLLEGSREERTETPVMGGFEGQEQSPANFLDWLEWAAYAKTNPLVESDLLLIGSTTAFRQVKCDCLVAETRMQLQHQFQLHLLKSRQYNAVHSSNAEPTRLLVQGGDIFAAEHRSLRDVLIESWEFEADECHPGDLGVLGGIYVSSCTRNAIRCSLWSLIKSASMQRWMQRFRYSARGLKIQVWEDFWNMDFEGIAKLWQEEVERQADISAIICMCLKSLKLTGYDTKRDEYNILWVQDTGDQLGKMRLERVVLTPTTHSWIRLLADSIDSCAMAVLKEECFSITTEAQEQVCRSRAKDCKQTIFPPRLQTLLQVNCAAPPFNRISPAVSDGQTSCQPKAMPPTKSLSPDVSGLEAGMVVRLKDPDCILRIVKPLAADHLLLEESTNPKVNQHCEHLEGHWECSTT